MSELKPRIHNETSGLDYVLAGDYYIPAIELPEDDDRPIGKWGRMHWAYLGETNPLLLNHLILTGKLHTYLADLNEQAQEAMNTRGRLVALTSLPLAFYALQTAGVVVEICFFKISLKQGLTGMYVSTIIEFTIELTYCITYLIHWQMHNRLRINPWAVFCICFSIFLSHT